MGKTILFGAGVYAKKYKALLEFLNMDFDYFTDNDPVKWGTTLYGKYVIPPDKLTKIKDCKIIISNTHEAEIMKQVSEMGLEQSIVTLRDLYGLCMQRIGSLEEKHLILKQDNAIIIDMYEGIGWGGSELWAANLAYGLQSNGKKSILVGGTTQPLLVDQFEELVVRFPENETIMQMVQFFEKNLPCVFINNFAGCAFFAAIIVKKKYPELLKIISVIHSDVKSLFDAHMLLQENIDKVFCVSKQIRIHMQSLYTFDKHKYYFKEQPIETDLCWHRVWNKEQPIRIGYAARIVKQAKRADLLIDLIASLEKRKCAYVLNIAGEGECVAILHEYISANKLNHKVHLLGRLPKNQMYDFWKKQDVFINISEYEGTSLSMLESMSFGCVPVTTDVSGAREFIDENINGYICKIGDIEGVAACIEELEINRDKLISYGTICRERIIERCNPEEYIDYWITNLLSV